MDTIVFSEKEQDLLRRIGVTAVILFGSQATGLAGRQSDYDIGILRKLADRTHDTAMYNDLYDVLSGKIRGLVNIDIVFLDEAPLELAMHVVRFGDLLFEARPGAFARFQEQVISSYADFAPYRNMFQEAILGRIPS